MILNFKIVREFRSIIIQGESEEEENISGYDSNESL